MAKQLPAYEDWKAPWEEKGEEFDAERARRLIFNLLGDKETLQSKVTAVTAERDEFRDKVDEYQRQDESETDRLKRERDEAIQRLNAVKDGEDPKVTVLKYKAAEKAGLPLSHAKYLSGTTEEEIEASVAEVKKDFALAKSDEGGDGSGTDPGAPRGRPRSRLTNPGDPTPDRTEVDVDKALDSIPRISGGF